MASGGQPPPQTLASEVGPVQRPGESPDATALRCLLPPPPWKVSLPAASRSFPEAYQRGAARLPAPSGTGPRLGATKARQAAGPVPALAIWKPPPPPRDLSQCLLEPKDWAGVVDERQLDAHLTQALGREARLWRGGQLQVPVLARGPPRSTFIPLLTRAPDAAVFHLHPGSGEPHPGVSTFPRCVPCTRQEAAFSGILTGNGASLIKKHLLHCVTITSLRLAAKVNEEEEVCIPGSSFSAAFEVSGCVTLGALKFPES
ncbi:cyclin-I2 isoform X4 [Camelus ferus]|uniref:Cyclin-I2 isoform X4 n=1 Tax=Camelus ferus TaxID=419612 RepID=A0A8B8SSY9_CAMFR|nr:cyclin-I2 isoform X4 [Camelus ferus]